MFKCNYITNEESLQLLYTIVKLTEHGPIDDKIILDAEVILTTKDKTDSEMLDCVIDSVITFRCGNEPFINSICRYLEQVETTGININDFSFNGYLIKDIFSFDYFFY